ncbi:MAG: hypothetical protein KA714_26065 [Limnoraphis sp. WC205]|nr:hypothetical protein [Limnoraphis sp. WC205]
MPKKVGVTLPDAIYEELEKIAGLQGRPPTTLAAFFIEFCLASGIGMAGLPIKRDSQFHPSSKIEPILEKALAGVPLNDEELETLAVHLNLDKHRLIESRNQNRQVNNSHL